MDWEYGYINMLLIYLQFLSRSQVETMLCLCLRLAVETVDQWTGSMATLTCC